jgi:hypothetical protein
VPSQFLYEKARGLREKAGQMPCKNHKKVGKQMGIRALLKTPKSLFFKNIDRQKANHKPTF